MKYKQLGHTDLKPSELGFGCSRIASLTTRYTNKEVSLTLAEAFEQGITFFDTANIYGQGDSERLLGKVLGQHRKDIIYCSKAGLTLSAPQHLIRYVKPFIRPILRQLRSAAKSTTKIRQQAEQQCFQLNYIQQQIEGSLRRLHTDYLDLFLLHNPPAGIIKQAEIFTLLDNLQNKGLIRHYGVSCRNHEDALLCLQYQGISSLQIHLDPVNIKSSKKLLDKIKVAGKGIIARECLHNKDADIDLSHQQPDTASLKKYNATQLALQAILMHDAIDVALIGMACRSHLKENLAVVQ